MWSRQRGQRRQSQNRSVSGRYTEQRIHPSEHEVDHPVDTEVSEMEFRLWLGVLLATGVVLVLLGTWLSGNVLRFLVVLLLVTAAVGGLVGGFWAAEHPARARVLWGRLRSGLSGR